MGGRPPNQMSSNEVPDEVPDKVPDEVPFVRHKIMAFCLALGHPTGVGTFPRLDNDMLYAMCACLVGQAVDDLLGHGLSQEDQLYIMGLFTKGPFQPGPEELLKWSKGLMRDPPPTVCLKNAVWLRPTPNVQKLLKEAGAMVLLSSDHVDSVWAVSRWTAF